jgi:hypothetical protein
MTGLYKTLRTWHLLIYGVYQIERLRALPVVLALPGKATHFLLSSLKRIICKYCYLTQVAHNSGNTYVVRNASSTLLQI